MWSENHILRPRFFMSGHVFNILRGWLERRLGHNEFSTDIHLALVMVHIIYI